MSDLYSEMILEYYKYPKNKKKLDNADIKYKLNNPLCGDECEIYVKLDEEKKVAEEITFDGRGCAISIASASILTVSRRWDSKTLRPTTNYSKKPLARP